MFNFGKYKLGMPTLIELDSLEDNINLCRELKLDLIEINMNLPQFQVEKLCKMKLDKDIQYSLHLPEETNVWDFNNYIREAHLKTIYQTIEIAKNKGIRILNMHMNPGVYFTLPNRKIFLFEKYRKFYDDKTRSFIQNIYKILKNSSIKIHIENTGIYNHTFIYNAVVDMLKFNCFALTWDVGHDYSSGNKDINLLKQMNSRIKHIHLHDAIKTSNHLPLGTGDIKIDDIFKIAGESFESIIFETKTVKGLKDSVDNYRKLID
jgi:sugar phosphate isomerase/epimerase